MMAMLVIAVIVIILLCGFIALMAERNTELHEALLRVRFIAQCAAEDDVRAIAVVRTVEAVIDVRVHERKP